MTVLSAEHRRGFGRAWEKGARDCQRPSDHPAGPAVRLVSRQDDDHDRRKQSIVATDNSSLSRQHSAPSEA
jgi:hypothetical protein